MHQELLSASAIALTFILFVPYIRGIHRGTIRPHAFSWLIWGLGTFIVFLAQLAGHGGVGAWPIGVSGVITLYISLLAYIKRGDLRIARADWVFLVAAAAALPLWFGTANPLSAVVVLTVADLIGFGPTIRKAYGRPHEESPLFFSLAAMRNLLVILALEHHSLTTVLFPAAVGLACLLLSLMLIVRRRSVANGHDHDIAERSLIH